MILTRRLLSVGHAVIGIASSFALLVRAANATAQASRVGATFEGTVSDSSRAVIPQAAITLRNTLTNQSRTVTLIHTVPSVTEDALGVGVQAASST